MYHIGDRFDRLVVVGLAKRTPTKYYVWCKCTCGKLKQICTSDLISGRVHSCGCFSKEIMHNRTQNKIKNIKLHHVFLAIKQRCYNPKCKVYKNYGGRGIKMAACWADRKTGFKTFEKWAIENGYKVGLTIDRVDNNGDYCPENCRWTTTKEQSNNKRTNHIIELDGIKYTMKQISEKFNIPYDRLRYRLKRGWDVQRAIFTPAQT